MLRIRGHKSRQLQSIKKPTNQVDVFIGWDGGTRSRSADSNIGDRSYQYHHDGRGGMEGYPPASWLLRLLIKTCKHVFISLHYADPRLFLRKSFGDSDPDQLGHEK